MESSLDLMDPIQMIRSPATEEEEDSPEAGAEDTLEEWVFPDNFAKTSLVLLVQ